MTLSADIDFLGNLIDGLEDLNSGRRDTYDARLLATYVRNETGVDIRFIGGLEDANDGEKKGVFAAIGAFFKKIFNFFFGKSEEQKRKEDESAADEATKAIESHTKEIEEALANVDADSLAPQIKKAIGDIRKNIGSDKNQLEKEIATLEQGQKAAASAGNLGGDVMNVTIGDSVKAKKDQLEQLKELEELEGKFNGKKIDAQLLTKAIKTSANKIKNGTARMQEAKKNYEQMEKTLKDFNSDTSQVSGARDKLQDSAVYKARIQVAKTLVQTHLNTVNRGRKELYSFIKLVHAATKSDVLGGVKKTLDDKTKETKKLNRQFGGTESFSSLEDLISQQTRARREGSRWY